MKSLYIFLFCSILVACGTDYGHQIVGGNLTIYFDDIDDQEVAENIALFWRDKKLMSDEKQDLKLIHNDDGHHLFLIAHEPDVASEMPFDERKLLLDLQKELRDHLDKQDIDLVICNDKFEPVYNINL